MNKSSQVFVRFLNLYRALNKGYTKTGAMGIHQEAIAILVFVSAQNELAQYPTITKIVQQMEFGTPPTIQRRLSELITLGFIEFCDGDDKRHRLLKVTVEGDAYLKACSKLMHDVVRPGSCDCPC